MDQSLIHRFGPAIAIMYVPLRFCQVRLRKPEVVAGGKAARIGEKLRFDRVSRTLGVGQGTGPLSAEGDAHHAERDEAEGCRFGNRVKRKPSQ